MKCRAVDAMPFRELTDTGLEGSMSLTQRMEQLSRAYVQAIAARAGFAVSTPSVDDDSIDLCISSRGYRRPRVETQLKSTTVPAGDSHIAFSLRRKNYDDLRTLDVIVPRILVVVLMPADVDACLEQSDEALVVRCAGCWTSVRGCPERDQQHITVHIPKSQRFDAENLSGLMDTIARGELL